MTGQTDGTNGKMRDRTGHVGIRKTGQTGTPPFKGVPDVPTVPNVPSRGRVWRRRKAKGVKPNPARAMTIANMVQRMTPKLGREPTNQEIADLLACGVERVAELRPRTPGRAKRPSKGKDSDNEPRLL